MGLGRRVFTPGEVLTASNVMNYLQDQVVMNFAGTAARGSAIGTAVQQGMVSYLNDSNTLQAYNGTTWKNVFPADASDIAAGTLATARGGTGGTTGAGLVPMIPTSLQNSGGSASYNTSTGLVTFSGVSAVSLNGVFTSAYRNYRLVAYDLNTASGVSSFALRFRSGGSDNVTNTYYQLWTMKRLNGSLVDNTGGPSTSYTLLAFDQNTGYSWNWTGDIMSPNIARNTVVTGLGLGADSTGLYTVTSQVLHATAAAFDGISFFPSSSTMSGSVKIYGYN